MAIASTSSRVLYSTLENSSSQVMEERRLELTKEVQHLEKVAYCRKVALKTMSCCCLPFAYLICCLKYVGDCDCDGTKGQYVDKEGIPFCECTTCDGMRCWHPALPPDNCSDMCWLGCDPCVFCVCCTKDKVENYLFPPERQVMMEFRGVKIDDRSNHRYVPHTGSLSSSRFVWAPR